MDFYGQKSLYVTRDIPTRYSRALACAYPACECLFSNPMVNLLINDGAYHFITQLWVSEEVNDGIYQIMKQLNSTHVTPTVFFQTAFLILNVAGSLTL